MKSPLARVLRLILAALVVVFMLPAIALAGTKPPSVRVIVVFDNAGVNATAMQHIARLGGVKTKDLPMVDGVAVSLPSQAAAHAVAGISGVKYVEPDLVVQALGKPVPPVPPQPAQEMSWGVYRVLGGNADLVWASNTADPMKVAVLDTGISTTHPDLVNNLKGGMSTHSYTKGSYNDDNGHGTMVAGFIAAENNSFGRIGVAPAADLYAVKVLTQALGGNTSDIIEGLQWVVANHMDVVNMSLGWWKYSASADSAVQETIASGVVVVAAAGNGGLTSKPEVGYPAAFPGVIAVSALTRPAEDMPLPGSLDQPLTIAPWSSRGTEVDLAAPGDGVGSTYLNQSYAIGSGTSYASPLVAGAAALVLTSPLGADDMNGNGRWDPNEVERRLERTAQDLGDPGLDPFYGYGLVRADLAVVAP